MSTASDPRAAAGTGAAARKIYTVSELNRAARTLLETHFSLIWLAGEISGLARPASGHLYFSLKDAGAQVRCALFRNRARLFEAGRRVANGRQVVVRARLSLYEPRGDYQLIVEHLEEAGEGALRRAFEVLKATLGAEGLFAADRKRPLPAFPRRLGVITSPSGAALRDVLSVLRRRFPALPVLIYPVQVQGEAAAAQMVRAIELADARRDCDVLLLTRGGGSPEDLAAFNDEALARAIAACGLPLVAGVGHEVDVTIADFVADLRAPTPSAAAELLSPDRREWLNRFARQRRLLIDAMTRRLRYRQQHLDRLGQSLARQHPGRRLALRREKLHELERRARQATARALERRSHALGVARFRLTAAGRAQTARVERLRERQTALVRRLLQAQRQQLQNRRQRLTAAGRALHDLSPLQTLARGYAIVRRREDDRIVSRVDQIRSGEHIDVEVADGRLACKVEDVRPDD